MTDPMISIVTLLISSLITVESCPLRSGNGAGRQNGFRVTADNIEVFDIFDAVKLFGKMLKEAKASGKCKISDPL